MQMPQPGAGHAQLKRLVGTWTGEEIMHPSPWDPEGGTATARTESRLGLGGFAVITDYQQERDGKVTFTGHGVWTFDQQAELCRLHWFDCMGSPPEIFEGPFEPDRLVMSHAGPMSSRLTYEWVGAKQMATKMEMSTDGKAWSTLFEGRYKRK